MEIHISNKRGTVRYTSRLWCPKPTKTDIFDQIYRYLEVVKAPSKLWLYRDQYEWMKKKVTQPRSCYQSKVLNLYDHLNSRDIKIEVINRE